MSVLNKSLLATAALLAGLTPGLLAHAETITWTTWTSATSGSSGSATGTMALGSGVTVTYRGQTGGLEHDTNWAPSSTYAGGNVSNAPDANAQQVWMTGGTTDTETITFSQAVLDPTMSFWSLGGGGGTTAVYNFDQAFAIEACGPSAELGGGCITQTGNTLFGNESNGTIQFAGTYTTLSFTTPVGEYWWDFTVGSAGLAPTAPPTTSVTPEPSSLALLGTGVAAAGNVIRRRMRLS